MEPRTTAPNTIPAPLESPETRQDLAPLDTPREIGATALGEVTAQTEAPGEITIIAGRITGLGKEALYALRLHPLYVGNDSSDTRYRQQSGL